MPYLNEKTGEVFTHKPVMASLGGLPPSFDSSLIEISEAEYHARALLDQDKTFIENEDFKIINKLVKKLTEERKPKPEITEAHYQCVVGLEGIDSVDIYYDGFEAVKTLKPVIPRLPVMIAAHKHDGSNKKPEWLKDDDLVIAMGIYSNNPLIGEAQVITWHGIEAYQLIPLLITGE